jgi:hypothetical protein
MRGRHYISGSASTSTRFLGPGRKPCDFGSGGPTGGIRLQRMFPTQPAQRHGRFPYKGGRFGGFRWTGAPSAGRTTRLLPVSVPGGPLGLGLKLWGGLGARGSAPGVDPRFLGGRANGDGSFGSLHFVGVVRLTVRILSERASSRTDPVGLVGRPVHRSKRTRGDLPPGWVRCLPDSWLPVGRIANLPFRKGWKQWAKGGCLRFSLVF